MARAIQRVVVIGLVAGLAVGLCLSATTAQQLFASEFQEPDPALKPSPTLKKQVTTAQKQVNTKKKGSSKKGNAKAAMPAELDSSPTPAATTPGAGNLGGLKFSRDIAPILVANCGGCHNATHRSKLNMTSFDGLLKGGNRGQDIVASKPEESLLVQRIKGEESPKMPPGQRNLSEAAIAKIEQWVKEGAKLDAGIDAAAAMAKYAPSAEEIRKEQLAKMKPDERDKKTEATGLDRIKKADPSLTMTVTKSSHFLLFSGLSKERGAALLKTMEAQYTFLDRLLGNGRTPGLSFPEKLSLYVFKERKGFTEYVRTVENQEVDATEEARGKLIVESPYLVAVDPLGGASESASPVTKRPTRNKRAADEPFAGPERRLAGLLTEQFTAGALNAAGKPPRWLTLGAGALLASKLEPTSPYYRRIRAEALEQLQQGWSIKATEALGDTTKPETQRAVGFAVCDWLYSNDPSAFANFTKGMLAGGNKLDDVMESSLGMSREAFLNGSGSFVMGRYGAGR